MRDKRRCVGLSNITPTAPTETSQDLIDGSGCISHRHVSGSAVGSPPSHKLLHLWHSSHITQRSKPLDSESILSFGAAALVLLAGRVDSAPLITKPALPTSLSPLSPSSIHQIDEGRRGLGFHSVRLLPPCGDRSPAVPSGGEDAGSFTSVRMDRLGDENWLRCLDTEVITVPTSIVTRSDCGGRGLSSRIA